MSNNLLIGALVAALLALGGLAWRHLALRRSLQAYTRQLQHSQTLMGEPLPADITQLEALSNTIHTLGLGFEQRLAGLEAERARLEATLTQMTDGVLIVDAQGRIQMSNPAADRLFGENATLIGKTVSLALRHHRLIETWRKCQQSGQLQSESVEIAATHNFLQLIAIPDQHAGGAILLVQDLTRMRRLETVRQDFISNVSHELRTPLASLKALTETLLEGALEDPPAARRFLKRIQTEVDALTQMANELLELSRIESGQSPLELRSVAPAGLLQSAAERMRTQAERAGLTLEVQSEAGLAAIRADFPRLEQVLVNLLHNAIKFTPAGGAIWLGAKAQGRFVHFEVRDSGQGIPADDLPRIFERFYRVDRARSGGGAGLGLSIARRLVEAHGGQIWAESREGSGSSFQFSIPVA